MTGEAIEPGVDFGRLVRASGVEVAEPSTVGELTATVRAAGVERRSLAVRGFALSQGGQSLPATSRLLSLHRLAAVGDVDAASETIECQAGATWRQVLRRTLEHGLVPVVLPNNLDLSVGGTLSVGGIGANSHRHGPIVAHVQGLAVVTGEGSVVGCSRREHPDLFAAVLGGVGAFGVIAHATLALRRTRRFVRVTRLLFDDISAWVEAQTALSREGVHEHLEGGCVSAGGDRWRFVLAVGREHDDVSAEGPTLVARGAVLEDGGNVDCHQFWARSDPRFDALRRSGQWAMAHPWVDAFVPLAQATEIVPAVLRSLPPDLADGMRLLGVRGGGLPRFLAAPPTSELACIAIVPPGISGDLDASLAALTRAHDLIVSSGGKRCLSGWLGAMGSRGWRDHLGPQFHAWVTARQQYDPRGVFDSAFLRAVAPCAAESMDGASTSDANS